MHRIEFDPGGPAAMLLLDWAEPADVPALPWAQQVLQEPGGRDGWGTLAAPPAVTPAWTSPTPAAPEAVLPALPAGVDPYAAAFDWTSTLTAGEGGSVSGVSSPFWLPAGTWLVCAMVTDVTGAATVSPEFDFAIGDDGTLSLVVAIDGFPAAFILPTMAANTFVLQAAGGGVSVSVMLPAEGDTATVRVIAVRL